MAQANARPGQNHAQTTGSVEQGRRTDFFGSPVGRRCCAAQEFRAERQLCPANKPKNFVLRPSNKAESARIRLEPDL